MRSRLIRLAVLLLPSLAWAGGGERVAVPAAAWPWSAVGRVNAVYSWCSGVLIGPRLVVTAAHCLWNSHTHRPMPPESVHFAAGWDRGEFLDASPVVGYRLAPGWSFAGIDTYGPAQAANDWALLDLAKPIGDTVGWVGLGEAPGTGQRVTTVGYGQDRKHVPTADIGCHLVGRLPAGALVHDCESVHGDSGGPVMVWKDGAPLLVAIHVASFLLEAGRRGGAVGVGEFAQAARAGAGKSSRPGPLSKPADPALVAKMAGH